MSLDKWYDDSNVMKPGVGTRKNEGAAWHGKGKENAAPGGKKQALGRNHSKSLA